MGNERSGNWGHSGRIGEVGGSGQGGYTASKFDRAKWAKMSLGDRKTAWKAMSTEEQDGLANARKSILARQNLLVAPLGEWQDTGNISDDVTARITAAKNEMSPGSLKLVSYTTTLYQDALRTAGVPEEEINGLMRNATDSIIAQELESQYHQLGDHGIHHITGDIDRAFAIGAVLPRDMSDQQKAELMTAVIYHDSGFLTEPSGLMLDKGHQRWSAQHYDENIKGMVTDSLGKDSAGNVGYYIRSHDSTEINWEEDPVGSSVRVSDNTAIFADDKLPGVFRDIPSNMRALTDYNNGKIDLETAKSTMLKNVDARQLSTAQQERYYNAVNEISGFTPQATLGMVGGDIADIAWVNDHVAITLKYNEQKTQDQKVLDLGQHQFAKFAKAYGEDPQKFTRTLNFQFEKDGRVLLEGKIQPLPRPKEAAYSGPIDNRMVT